MINNNLNFKYLLEKYADCPALIWPDGKLTYLQYFKQINQISEALKKYGIQSGSRVAILYDIHHHFPILFFAVLSTGGIVIPISPKIPEKKIHSLIEKSGCDLVITFDRSFSPAPENKIDVLYGESLFDPKSIFDESDVIPSLPLSQEATVIFTSGTQGNPKGVLHTIGNHYYSALGSNKNIPLNTYDCWMVALPFFHIAGIAILFRTLIAGAACLIPDKNKQFQDQLNEYNVTHISLVSTQLHRWLADDNTSESAASLKAILLGGSQIPPTLIKQALQQKLPIHASYGSTEMSSQITTTSGDDLVINPHSSGKLLSYQELKIDENGEILVKGKTLCTEYISGNEVDNCGDTKSWFHTGDLGYFDDNQNLIIKGRLDNMFISGGENIYPEEIEKQLQFHNQIIDVCVVEVPDKEYGARPVAFIKMEATNKIDESQIKKYLEDKIAGFKIPVRFLTWPENLKRIKPDRDYFRELANAATINDSLLSIS
jgi:O-succinylbenzoic acid--CoA ligase